MELFVMLWGVKISAVTKKKDLFVWQCAGQSLFTLLLTEDLNNKMKDEEFSVLTQTKESLLYDMFKELLLH